MQSDKIHKKDNTHRKHTSMEKCQYCRKGHPRYSILPTAKLGGDGERPNHFKAVYISVKEQQQNWR